MKKKDSKIKYSILLFSTIFIITIIPIVIDWLIIGNSFPSNINNSEWVSFLGNYIGSLVGAAATLIGIAITLKFTIKQANEERRLGVSPYLKYTQHKKSLLNKEPDINIFMYIDEFNSGEAEDTLVNSTLTLKNVGNGPALDMIVDNIFYGDKKSKAVLCGSDGVLEKGSEFHMLIDLRMVLIELNNENLVKADESSIIDFYPPREHTNGKTLSMTIKYKDLIGNKYEQTLEFGVNIFLTKDEKEREWKYGQPEIHFNKIGDNKINP